MNIILTDAQYRLLTAFSRSSKVEQSAVLRVRVDGDDILFSHIVQSTGDEIVSATKKNITFDTKVYLTKTLYSMIRSENGVYVQFHTHPGFSSNAALSSEDEALLQYLQELSGRVTEIHGTPITIIEGVITNYEAAFYSYDCQSNTVNRLPLFVDGEEKVPLFEKNLLQVAKDSFTKGFQKGIEKTHIFTNKK